MAGLYYDLCISTIADKIEYRYIRMLFLLAIFAFFTNSINRMGMILFHSNLQGTCKTFPFKDKVVISCGQRDRISVIGI